MSNCLCFSKKTYNDTMQHRQKNESCPVELPEVTSKLEKCIPGGGQSQSQFMQKCG